MELVKLVVRVAIVGGESTNLGTCIVVHNPCTMCMMNIGCGRGKIVTMTELSVSVSAFNAIYVAYL